MCVRRGYSRHLGPTTDSCHFSSISFMSWLLGQRSASCSSGSAIETKEREYRRLKLRVQNARHCMAVFLRAGSSRCENAENYDTKQEAAAELVAHHDEPERKQRTGFEPRWLRKCFIWSTYLMIARRGQLPSKGGSIVNAVCVDSFGSYRAPCDPALHGTRTAADCGRDESAFRLRC